MIKVILAAIDYRKIFSYLIEFLITQVIKFALKKDIKFVKYVEDFNKITDKFIVARDVVNSVVDTTNSPNISDKDKETIFGNIMSNKLPALSKLD